MYFGFSPGSRAQRISGREHGRHKYQLLYLDSSGGNGFVDEFDAAGNYLGQPIGPPIDHLLELHLVLGESDDRDRIGQVLHRSANQQGQIVPPQS